MAVVLSLLLAASVSFSHVVCAALRPPVDGVIVRGFAPVGRFGGHWGVDFKADPGTPVTAAGGGVVTFAGSVAGRLSVTIAHGGGLRTSYSYLDTRSSWLEVIRSSPVRSSACPGCHTASRRCTSRCASATSTGIRRIGCTAPPCPHPRSGWRRCSGGRFILGFVRRGILGGTFDPPHIAHLFAGEAAYRDLRLDVVTYLPAGAPWQKADRDLSDAEDRLEMTRLAVEGVPYFEVDDREIVRDGWTYTVDTLGEFPDDELVLIVGSDAAVGIPTWHRPEDVMSMADIAVAPRPGAGYEDVAEALGEGFHWLTGPELDLSATMLRDRLVNGHSVRFLVPDAVRRYIEEVGLYTADGAPSA